MTTENNKILADFLGQKYYKIDCNIKEGYISFNNDWNWLMEVVEKIENFGFKLEIFYNHCEIIEKGIRLSDIGGTQETKIESVYNACVAFIKWYNKNSTKEN